MNDVCSLELLTNAVANRLTADEETALYDHLERCEACCARMEQLAGGEQWQKEAASLLTTDELDAAVPELMVWSEVDFSVEHLEPSEDANVLGQLGGYDVLAIIGRGGMGVVLKAFDRELKRFVAIKALSPHLAHSSVARKRFAREAQAAAAVVNPHVIAIHHVQPTGRLPFLIMPLLTGESLAQRLKSRAPLELTEVLRIGMQAAVGLAAAHDQGLVHRDVKPANIFLEKGVERVLITDFGLARAADDVSMTRLGVVAGTPEYMSPEQARGEALDGRSDLFSLGCVLYEMATGVSPFRSDSTIATLRRIVDEKPAAIASLAPELPPWFSYIVERLLSKGPAQRFDSASEVALLLEACLSHLQQPTSVPLPASLPVHAQGRRSVPNSNRIGMLIMLGSLGMALLGMVLWQATDPPDISGQWTGDEWGTVVLEAKGPGLYVGTFGGTNKGKPAPVKAHSAGASGIYGVVESMGTGKSGDPAVGKSRPEKEPFTAWGEEVGGLQAGLGFDYGNRRTYGHGQVVTLVVRLRNVGREAVKFEYLRQYFDENPPAVTDADGIAVPQCNTEVVGQHVPVSENLEPGKEMVLETQMHGSNGMPYVLIPSNSKDLKLDENFRPLIVGTGKVQFQIEKVFGNSSSGLLKVDRTLEKLSTGKLELEVNNQPADSGFSGSSSEILHGSPRASGVPPGSNQDESGTLLLKWSRVERRFNGTWKSGENRNGKMSLRLVDNEIRGAWTTNKGTQKDPDSPRLADLRWKRNGVADGVYGEHKAYEDPESGTQHNDKKLPKTVTLYVRYADYHGGPFDLGDYVDVYQTRRNYDHEPWREWHFFKNVKILSTTPVVDASIDNGSAWRLEVKVGADSYVTEVDMVTMLPLYEKAMHEGRVRWIVRPAKSKSSSEKVSDTLDDSIVSVTQANANTPEEEKAKYEAAKAWLRRPIVGSTNDATNSQTNVEVRQVFADIDGEVHEVLIGDNSVITKGQLLLRIRNSELQGELSKTSDQVNEAKLELDRLVKKLQDNKDLPVEDVEKAERERSELQKRVLTLSEQMTRLNERCELLVVKSTVAGKVITKNVEQLLKNRFVVAGQVLLEIAIEPSRNITEKTANYAGEDGAVVTIPLKAEWVPEDWLKRNIGRRHLTIVADGVIQDQAKPNAVNRVQRGILHDCRLESFEKMHRNGVEYWNASLFVPRKPIYSIGALWFKDAIHTLRIGDRHTPVPSPDLLQDNPQIKLDEAMKEGHDFRLDFVTLLIFERVENAETAATPSASVASESKAPALDHRNARSVVEAYVASALAGDVATAASLAKNSPADPKRIRELPEFLSVQRLKIETVYINDPAKPTLALATSVAVKLDEEHKNPDGRRDGFMVFTLEFTDEKWFVIDIDFKTESGAEKELNKFRKANPNSIGIPPQS